MGAVALSKQDETTLGSLQKILKIPSKSQVIHRALQELQTVVARQALAREIRRSVVKCGRADFKEHGALTGAAYHRLEK